MLNNEKREQVSTTKRGGRPMSSSTSCYAFDVLIIRERLFQLKTPNSQTLFVRRPNNSNTPLAPLLFVSNDQQQHSQTTLDNKPEVHTREKETKQYDRIQIRKKERISLLATLTSTCNHSKRSHTIRFPQTRK